MVEFLFVGTYILYFIFIVWVMIYWRYNEVIVSNLPFLSIVVVVRNEESNIMNLLTDFSKLDYPSEQIEFIIVDDNSTDFTLKLIRENSLNNLSFIRLGEYNGSPKKNAITKAVSVAQGDYILCTDGDCRIKPFWASKMAAFINHKYDYVCAPVIYSPVKGLFQRLQAIEMLSLVGITAGMINVGYPAMSNAANMIFKKNSFKKIAGYQGLESVISGDDELLMHKFKKQGCKVAYLSTIDVIVKTKPNVTLSELTKQRRRWGSKWKYYQLPYVKVVALFIFFLYLLTIFSFSLVLKGVFPVKIFLNGLMLKFVLEYFFVKLIKKDLLRESLSMLWFLLTFLVYPIYVVFIGILSNFKGFEWKGRKY